MIINLFCPTAKINGIKSLYSKKIYINTTAVVSEYIEKFSLYWYIEQNLLQLK